MDSLGGNILPPDPQVKTYFAGIAVIVLGIICLSKLFSKTDRRGDETPGLLRSFLLFFYSCFIKPHNGDQKGTQQDALESFYAKQKDVYDNTRKVLLKGREDMLALVAAQLEAKAKKEGESGGKRKKRIWVDVGTFFNTGSISSSLTRFSGWRWHGVEHRGHVRISRRSHLLFQRLSRRLLSIAL
jgi:betaine lipid synthase